MLPVTNALVAAMLVLGVDPPARVAVSPPINAARVQILSTMVSDDYVGEWGFAAVVEANGRRILFDTGARPDTVAQNAKALGLDLSGVTDVVLSHWHGDHTGGLVALRRELMKQNKAALSRAHVGRGFFWPRKAKGKAETGAQDLRRDYEALGGTFVEHVAASELLPGVWVTGEVPRRTSERNFPKGIEVQRPDGRWTEDDVPDDLSVVLDSTKGLVVVTGCGHAGVVNTVEAAKERVRAAPVAAIIGGLHLFEADDARVDWTAGEFKRLGVAHLVGAHCTGIEATMRLRHGSGLDRKTAVVGAVGASFDLETGIDPGDLAR
jgi:7,8-dihydropterin-6-yl-methyl-4-(beta-D-ribofuranosyl)aminobenzene 5'-phosphate synthase